MSQGRAESLADKIVIFQEKFHLTDTELSLKSHLPVEKIHGIKQRTYQPQTDEEQVLSNFIANYRAVK
ncbi:LBP_cg2779 family protein [Liquorilactobacillus sicerae]|uniref:LBP_cg2779 family protein n=1 Tax=Liquorilactobacillus sicerae TaxID=1416943 RepID=UPI002480051E|nr:LBP_cg2779 family protein [Liquorilactobacillus sicerae]